MYIMRVIYGSTKSMMPVVNMSPAILDGIWHKIEVKKVWESKRIEGQKEG